LYQNCDDPAIQVKPSAVSAILFRPIGEPHGAIEVGLDVRPGLGAYERRDRHHGHGHGHRRHTPSLFRELHGASDGAFYA
jgi:hypothetical protein